MDTKVREMLALAERNVLEGQGRIDAQRALLAGLDPGGADAAVARETLHSHLATQIILHNHLRQLRRVLEAESNADQNGAPRQA